MSCFGFQTTPSVLMKYSSDSISLVSAVSIRSLINGLKDGLKPSEGSPPTKRQIISKVPRIFHPLGRYSPIVIQLESLIQALCLDQLSWDDPLNQNLLQQYQNLCSSSSQSKKSRFQGALWIRISLSKKNLYHFKSFVTPQ